MWERSVLTQAHGSTAACLTKSVCSRESSASVRNRGGRLFPCIVFGPSGRCSATSNVRCQQAGGVWSCTGLPALQPRPDVPSLWGAISQSTRKCSLLRSTANSSSSCQGTGFSQKRMAHSFSPEESQSARVMSPTPFRNWPPFAQSRWRG